MYRATKWSALVEVLLVLLFCFELSTNVTSAPTPAPTPAPSRLILTSQQRAALDQCSFFAKVSTGYPPVNLTAPEVVQALSRMIYDYYDSGVNVFCPLIDIYSKLFTLLFNWRRCMNSDPFCNVTSLTVNATLTKDLTFCAPYYCSKNPGRYCKTNLGMQALCNPTPRFCPFVCFQFPRAPLTPTQVQLLNANANQLLLLWQMTKRTNRLSLNRKRFSDSSSSAFQLLTRKIQSALKRREKKRSSSSEEEGAVRRQVLSTACPYCGCIPGEEIACTSCAVHPSGTPCFHTDLRVSPTPLCCQCVGLF